MADVFETHQGFMETVARRHAPAPDHVPDIVQAVAIKLCTGLQGFREQAQLRTWLYRVTVNESRNHFKRERRFQRVLEAVQTTPIPDVIVDPDAILIDQERVAALRAAIGRLKATYRKLVRNSLRDPAVLDNRQRTTRHRARQQLRTLLADDPRLG